MLHYCKSLFVFQIEGDVEAVASKMASELIARIDTDGNGTLDEHEFLTVRFYSTPPILTKSQHSSLKK